jgi:hypothetical protein
LKFTTPALIASLLVAPLSAATAAEAPLRIRNLAPAALVFGLPRAMGADLLGSGYEMSFTTELANHFTSAARGGDAAFFDGETLLLTWAYRRAFADRFEWGVEVPYVVHDGGVLDAGIDTFHDLFGFDDNGRDRAQRNRVDYFVRVDGRTWVDFQNSRRDWGDLRATFGYQLDREPGASWSVRGLLKLPTGEAEKMTGSEATDFAVWLEHGRSDLFGHARASLSAALGAVWLGEGDIAPDRQENVAGYAHFGLGWRAFDNVSLLGQLDYHSRLIDSRVDQVASRALQGTLGARFRYKERLTTDFSFVEDLTGDSTSDVLFQLLFAVRL